MKYSARPALVIVLTALAIGYFSYSQRSADPREIDFFSSALRSAHVQDAVSIKGTVYVVSDGTVTSKGAMGTTEVAAALQLTYEKTLAQRNPLMALPGVDPKAMRVAVAELQETAILLSMRGSGIRDASLIAASLYPVDFLTAVTQLEETRQNFLHSGSDADAFLYRMQLDRTIRAYERDTARYRSAFKQIVPANAEAFVTQTEIVTRQMRFDALDMLDTAASQTATLAAKRNSCVRGAIDNCDISEVLIPRMEVPEVVPVSDSARSLAQHIRQLFRDPVGYEMESPDMSLFLLNKSSCIQPRSGTALLFTFRNEPTQSGSFSLPLFLGDVNFIPSAQFVGTPYYSHFAASGIAYVQTSPLMYYTCQEADEDIGTLEAMRQVRDLALNDDLSVFASGQEKITMAHFEDLAREGSIITEHDAAEYLNAAADLVGTAALPGPTSERILVLLLQQRDHSIGIFKTILNINSTERMNMRLSDSGIPMTFSPIYLFFSRSAFAALFMQTNGSATGIHPRLFLPNTLSGTILPYVYYSALPKDAATQKMLVRDMSFLWEMHYGSR
jgi:hypothetical protein